LALLLILAIILTFRFGSGNGHLATHEMLVVEDFHRTSGFIDVEHFHESVAFGAVGTAVVNDLDVAHRTDSLEEFLKVLLGDIVRQITDVNPGGFDAVRISATWGSLAAFSAFSAFGSVRARGVTAFFPVLRILAAGIAGVGLGFAGFGFFLARLAGWRGGLLVEADGLEQLLPPAQLHRLVLVWRAWGLRAEFLRAAVLASAVRVGFMLTTAAVLLVVVVPTVLAAA
jgi:hypothetical protein